MYKTYAADWVLDQVYYQDDYSEDYTSADLASASNATASDADYGVSLLSSHNPYDSGSVSSTVVNYMSDVLPKLGSVHYVLFRSGQYVYRMYYSKDMTCNGSTFVADDAAYIEYDTRYYTWGRGSETNFGLNAGSTIVYSDLGDYPMLGSADTASWVLVMLGAAYFIFVILRSWFASKRHVI